jgi:hypothetical protein
MDRAPLGAVAPWLPAAPPSSELVLARLDAYWRALGVTDPQQRAALSEQTLRRASEWPETSGSEPVAQALSAARNLLDDWLARTLDLSQQPQALAAARAALLSGAAPDWPAALFAPPGEAEDVRDALRAAIAEPTPPLAPGAMPAQPIELFSFFGLVRRWRRSGVRA